MKKSNTRVKFKNNHAQKKINYVWIMAITVITFIFAIVLGYFSLIFMEQVSLAGAVMIVMVIVFIGIFFDLLGIAVTAATETPFHSMAASRVRGAKESILLIRNAGAVANFFNDVIGDISGIISGSASAAIIVKINSEISIAGTFFSIVLTAIIAGITVGGKAIGKEIALSHANYIVYRIGFIMSLVKTKRG